MNEMLSKTFSEMLYIASFIPCLAQYYKPLHTLHAESTYIHVYGALSTVALIIQGYQLFSIVATIVKPFVHVCGFALTQGYFKMNQSQIFTKSHDTAQRPAELNAHWTCAE